jgi:uncharacterized protein
VISNYSARTYRPTPVEGLPGVGIVGKLATDHLVEAFEMVRYATVHREGPPPVATCEGNSREPVTPVRPYADGERGLLALRSDAPVAPAAALEFADRLSAWGDGAVFPISPSGADGRAPGPRGADRATGCRADRGGDAEASRLAGDCPPSHTDYCNCSPVDRPPVSAIHR